VRFRLYPYRSVPCFLQNRFSSERVFPRKRPRYPPGNCLIAPTPTPSGYTEKTPPVCIASFQPLRQGSVSPLTEPMGVSDVAFAPVNAFSSGGGTFGFLTQIRHSPESEEDRQVLHPFFQLLIPCLFQCHPRRLLLTIFSPTQDPLLAPIVGLFSIRL